MRYMGFDMLELVNVTKHLDDKPVFIRVNISAANGEITKITGGADSGRSTLLRIMGGIIRPDGGSVVLDDRPVFDNRISRQKLFYISDVPVPISMAGLKQVAGFYKKMYGRFDEASFDEICSEFGIDRKFRFSEKKRPECVKSMLAVGMALDPEFILIDEPFYKSDDAAKKVIKEMILYAARKKKTGVIYTADAEDENDMIADVSFCLDRSDDRK